MRRQLMAWILLGMTAASASAEDTSVDAVRLVQSMQLDDLVLVNVLAVVPSQMHGCIQAQDKMELARVQAAILAESLTPAELQVAAAFFAGDTGRHSLAAYYATGDWQNGLSASDQYLVGQFLRTTAGQKLISINPVQNGPAMGAAVKKQVVAWIKHCTVTSLQ